MSQRVPGNASTGLAPPAVQRVLHLGGIRCHHQIGQECQGTGLRDELLLTTTATRPESGPPNLPLERVDELAVVQETQRLPAKIRDAERVAEMDRSKQQSERMAGLVCLFTS